MESLVGDAVDALEEAQDRDAGMLFTGGKDSMVMLHLWREHVGGGHPPLFVIDTDNQFESIYNFRAQIAQEWALEYNTYRNDAFLDSVVHNDEDDRGFAWDGPKTDGCCQALKIDMIQQIIQDGQDTLIVGRRAADVGHDLPVTDEGYAEPAPHDRIHPLADWSDAHISAYITKHRIPLPSVYDEGYDHTDCVDCVAQGEEGDDWSGMDEGDRAELQQLRDMGYM